MPHLEDGEVVEESRDGRTEVKTGKQSEHDHLDEKGWPKIGARRFPANRKRGSMMRMEGSHRGNSEELRLAVVFRLRLADDRANPLDQLAKVVRLLHRVDDAGAKYFRAQVGLQVSAGHYGAHARLDFLHPQKDV